MASKELDGMMKKLMAKSKREWEAKQKESGVVLYIQMPEANNDWVFVVWGAIEEYIQKSDSTWVSYAEGIARPKHVAIRLPL